MPEGENCRIGNLRHMDVIAGNGFRDAGYGLRVTGHGLRDAGCEMRVHPLIYEIGKRGS
jgi:hypothetical protein